MKKPRKPLFVPYDHTVTISFSGITRGDGVKTLTPNMLIDKITHPLANALAQGQIRDYTVSVKVNNLETAKQVIAKSKKEY